MSTYLNVWDALFDDKQEAENLRIRSQLMIEITQYLNQINLSQKQAAEKLGISQPRLSNLINGQIDKFTIDMLVNILSKTDSTVKFTVTHSADIKEKTSPWKNFNILAGGRKRRKTIKKGKIDWDISIQKPINMACIG